jgi:5-methyltetrahydrofolate--homocysteine methyltransferase
MIHFTDKQWDTVRENYRRWWKNELGRPILPMIIRGADPERLKPDAPPPSFLNCTDLSITPEQIIDSVDYQLSCLEFYGDSYPFMGMAHFGPGIAAAFMGAEIESAQNTVWFHPLKKVPVSELHLTYDPDNFWLSRIKDIYRAGIKRWGGSVCMAMTDIGGVMDVLATFLSTEELLYALVDEPDEVRRLSGEISSLIRQYYDEITDIIKEQQGFTDWASIYSEKPSYMLQCDFCYMIGKDMFDAFVRDELALTAGRLYNPFYHLDGIGALRHLDSLLSINEIKGIQWVPGEGEPRTRDWSEVFAKISCAGKKIQAYYNFEFHFEEILAVIKHPDDLVKMQFAYSMDKKQDALRKLSRYCEVTS